MSDKKQTLVINLMAGAGAGKSTTAAKVFANLKDANIDCELVREVVKEAVWENNQSILTDELLIFANQNHALHRLNGKVDVIITDAPLYLKLFYQPKEYKFTSLVLEVAQLYNNITFFIDRVKPYNPNGRTQTESEALADDITMLTLLNKHNIPHGIVPGNDEGARWITNCVLDELRRMGIL